jgi:hypothetical protein
MGITQGLAGAPTIPARQAQAVSSRRSTDEAKCSAHQIRRRGMHTQAASVLPEALCNIHGMPPRESRMALPSAAAPLVQHRQYGKTTPVSSIPLAPTIGGQ